MRRAGEFGDESLKRLEIGRDAFEDEIDLARQHPAFAHQRLLAHIGLEGIEVGFRLARQMHHGEGDELVAEPLLVEQAAIALDEARLLQRPHPPQTGRRRNADPARQFHIGDAAVVLQFGEDFQVDRIEASEHAFGTPRFRDRYSPSERSHERKLRRFVQKLRGLPVIPRPGCVTCIARPNGYIWHPTRGADLPQTPRTSALRRAGHRRIP